MSALSDAVITYAIIRKLTTPIIETNAYKLGLVDVNGVPTYAADHTYSEAKRDAYTLLDRLVFKLKRSFDKMPAFHKLVGSYASSLAFIKESTDIDDFSVFEHLDSYVGEYWSNVISEGIPVRFEDHVVVQIAENASLLSALVDAYTNGTQDSVCEEMAASVAASGNSVGSGQVQGLATEPVIRPETQKKWSMKNKGRKIEEILP